MAKPEDVGRAPMHAVVNRRLGFAAGEAGQLAMMEVISGPIRFDDAPQAVQDLFNDEAKKVTRVIVVHRDLNTDEKPRDGFVWVWDKMSD